MTDGERMHFVYGAFLGIMAIAILKATLELADMRPECPDPPPRYCPPIRCK